MFPLQDVLRSFMLVESGRNLAFVVPAGGRIPGQRLETILASVFIHVSCTELLWEGKTQRTIEKGEADIASFSPKQLYPSRFLPSKFSLTRVNVLTGFHNLGYLNVTKMFMRKQENYYAFTVRLNLDRIGSQIRAEKNWSSCEHGS